MIFVTLILILVLKIDKKENKSKENGNEKRKIENVKSTSFIFDRATSYI